MNLLNMTEDKENVSIWTRMTDMIEEYRRNQIKNLSMSYLVAQLNLPSKI